MVLGLPDIYMEKNINVYPYPTPCVKVNSRLFTDQKGKGKIINIIKNNIFYTDIFLNTNQNENLNKLDYIKI